MLEVLKLLPEIVYYVSLAWFLISEMVGAIIVVLILAILYELLKTFRELLMYYDLQRIQRKLPVYRRSESREKLMMNDTETNISLWVENIHFIGLDSQECNTSHASMKFSKNLINNFLYIFSFQLWLHLARDS